MIRDKLSLIVKGAFASPDGRALIPSFGEAANTHAGPLKDLTQYLSAMPPLPAQGPESYEIRRYDFPIATNLDITPGGGKYGILRGLADRCALLRSVIDTKKDQVASVDWSIKVEPKEGETKSKANKRAKSDPVVQQLTRFFESPDGEHTWYQWLRILLEETYVIDAPCIEFVRDKEDKIAKLEVIAGDTINRLIDDRGWTPAHPQKAYQQIVSGSGGSGGVPQRDLTTKDLIFYMRNPRAGHKWGQSSVEKIAIYAMTLIYADEFYKAYYTAGNQPPGLYIVGGLTPTQLEEMDRKFNAAYAGNIAKRQQIAFLPAGMDGKPGQYVATKAELLKSDVYADLIRKICFEFSVSKVPLEQAMNRASAQADQGQAKEEGIETDLEWLEQLMNLIIKDDKYFGLNGYTFVFGPRRDVDPLKQAQVDTMYAKNAVLSVDEVRDDLGKEPMADKVKEAGELGVMTPNNGWVPLNRADLLPSQTQSRPTPATPGQEPGGPPTKPQGKEKPEPAK